MLHTIDEAASHVLDAVRAGRCVCWLRNTVADAIQAFERLRPELGDRVDLFHARFAMSDRLAIQERALAAFGKDSTAARRRGRVLVATQVVEQSLDLDFDTMVTDLAPMDRLMQRAGRVLRHPRDAKGNRLTPPGASDERGTPTLAVLAPAPVDDPGPDWYAEAFPIAQWVYPSHGQLWLTARLLAERGGWTLPGDARPLIESVFGDEADEIPPALQARDNKAFGAAQADRSLAQENALELEQGYRPTFRHWVDEEHTPTRLGERTVPVYLARRQADRYVPWCDHPRHPWAMSRLNVPRRWIAPAREPDDPALRSALAECREQLPDKGRWSVLLPLEPEADGTWHGEADDAKGNLVPVHYDGRLGFRIGGEGEE
jgi:CRISPR-associated endonuclease/helicase Cas3